MKKLKQTLWKFLLDKNLEQVSLLKHFELIYILINTFFDVVWKGRSKKYGFCHCLHTTEQLVK